MSKIAVVGSRDFDDYEWMKTVLTDYLDEMDLLVSGGARGADSLGARFAKEHRVQTLIFKPDWETHGKAAGPIRNKQIVEACDVLIAFWDGKSKGTKNSIDTARRLRKKVVINVF